MPGCTALDMNMKWSAGSTALLQVEQRTVENNENNEQAVQHCIARTSPVLRQQGPARTSPLAVVYGRADTSVYWSPLTQKLLQRTF